jgi:hypothetical protein
VLSLEHDPVDTFAELFEGHHVVVFSAGAGGKGGEERTKAVDYQGALKVCMLSLACIGADRTQVFDAIDMMEGPKPHLILVSAIDVRAPDKIPAHYVRHLNFDRILPR